MSDYARIERAILYLCGHVREQPSLEDVAAHVGLSAFHFQRLFQRWAGVSPKRFLQVLTLRDAKALLQESRSLLETSLEVGLSGPSRLHDLFVTLEHLTPGDFKAQARGLTVHWKIAETPLGPALFAALDRGLCGLSFLSGGEGEAFGELRARWPLATLREDGRALKRYVELFESRLRGQVDGPLSLVLKGTPLQFRTWEALLRIPPGKVLSYGDLAKLVGSPRAARAVGAAVGQNPVAGLIPCHRAIYASGALGHYHWGWPRKLALFGMEQARSGGEQLTRTESLTNDRHLNEP